MVCLILCHNKDVSSNINQCAFHIHTHPHTLCTGQFTYGANRKVSYICEQSFNENRNPCHCPGGWAATSWSTWPPHTDRSGSSPNLCWEHPKRGPVKLWGASFLFGFNRLGGVQGSHSQSWWVHRRCDLIHPVLCGQYCANMLQNKL